MTPPNPQKTVSRREMLKTAGEAAVNAAVSSAAIGLPFTGSLADSLTPANYPLPPLGVVALNRLAFGLRPGSFDASTFSGMAGATDTAKLASFLEWQMLPAAINDSECDARIAAANLPTLTKSLAQLWADHHEAQNGDRTQPVREVTTAAFIRAVYSKRQLYEKMTTFWHNHFSIYAWDYEYASATWASYDRDVIRAHVFGNFRQMLGSVATHPAMLYYLSNYINQAGGPNENWARELFELHTLGAENYLGTSQQATVPGYPAAPVGYVDSDVFETTRCFTGWRVDDGDYPLTTHTGEFLYYKDWHDHFQKTVLGKFIPANQGDLADGRNVLDALAAHPGTGRFITRKLCRYLIGDNPPQTVLAAAAAAFTANVNAPDQLARVLRVIVNSPAFQTTWADKLKRPFESAVSQLRALNADFTPTDDFNWNYEAMNEALFAHRAPDGYADLKDRWTNTTSMLKRWQLAVYLTENDINGAHIDVVSQNPGPVNTANGIVDYWVMRLLGRPLSTDAARTRLVDFVRGPHTASFALSAADVAAILPRFVALLLMSPDFQVY